MLLLLLLLLLLILLLMPRATYAPFLLHMRVAAHCAFTSGPLGALQLLISCFVVPQDGLGVARCNY